MGPGNKYKSQTFLPRVTNLIRVRVKVGVEVYVSKGRKYVRSSSCVPPHEGKLQAQASPVCPLV